MLTNRTHKLLLSVAVSVLAVLSVVLPAMAMIPVEPGERRIVVKPPISRSTPIPQSVPATTAQTETAAPAPAAAPASTIPIITVDAGPVARPIVPVTSAVVPASAPAIEETAVKTVPAISPNSGGETEFTGTISSLTGVLPNLTLTVGVYTVTTNSQTEISGTLNVGVLVEVKGTPQPDGSILASRVHVQDVGGETEVEFRGPIVALPADPDFNGTWIVGDISVTVDVATTVLPTRTAAALGLTAEVKAQHQPDGSLRATRIQIEHGIEGEVEFRGPIMSLPADPDLNGNWVVGDFSVTVNLTTTVIPSRTAAVIGAIAEVKAARQPDGSLLASRIQIEDEHEFENEAEFKGIVSDLTGSNPYTMTVAGHVVKTDAQTEISGTLANGALVEVKGALQSDGSVLASWIKVEDQTEPVEVEFTAHITGTLPPGLLGVWTFDNGQTVTVVAGTLIDQSRGMAEVGVLVEVKALKQADNSLVAVRIRVEDQ